jgi:dienelactone hydrolase
MIYQILILFFLMTSKVSAQLIPSLNIIKEKAPFPGYMYRPNDELSHPAIILLHGSEGGNADYWYKPGNPPKNTGGSALVPYMARYYAMLGHVTYAVCYFDCKHHKGYSNYPPDELKNVDLMKVTYPALTWLKNYKYVEHKKVILWGASRGAEQAILLATRLTELQEKDPLIILPDGVVSLSPLERVAAAFPQEVADAMIVGQPIAFPKNEVAWLINGEKQKNYDVIQISKFPNPVLITSFQTDPVWRYIDMQVLKDQYQPADLVSISMAPSDLVLNKSKEIPNSFGRVTFFEMLDTGHVYPKYGSEESKVMDRILQYFFKDVLKP